MFAEPTQPDMIPQGGEGGQIGAQEGGRPRYFSKRSRLRRSQK